MLPALSGDMVRASLMFVASGLPVFDRASYKRCLAEMQEKKRKKSDYFCVAGPAYVCFPGDEATPAFTTRHPWFSAEFWSSVVFYPVKTGMPMRRVDGHACFYCFL
jgi:hypothetical protein